MNPLHLLNDQVTPQVVNQHQLDIDIDKKASLLSQFYPVLLATFHRFPDRIQDVIHVKNDALKHVFSNQKDALQDLIAGLSKHHSVPTATVTSLLDAAIPLSAKVLQDHAGKGKVAAYLHQHLAEIANAFPAWGAGVLTSLGLNGALTANQKTQHVYTEERKAGGYMALDWCFDCIFNFSIFSYVFYEVMSA